MDNSIFKISNYKKMAIIFAVIFMILNIAIILFNNSYLGKVIKQKELEFIEIVTHMIEYEDEEATALFIEHYSHVNNIEATLYEGETIIYQTNDLSNSGSSYDIELSDGKVIKVVLDFSNSIDRAMNNDFIIFVNVIIVLAYIVIIVVDIDISKKNNKLLKLEIDNIENSLNKKKYNTVYKEFSELATKINALHKRNENISFDKLMYSHEIKTSLMIILNMVESLKSDSDLVSSDLIEEIKSEIFVVNDYIEGINNNLDKCINVSAILSDHIKKHETIMKTKDISLISKVDENVMLNMSEQDFNVVVSNLLSNAFFYSNKGGKVNVLLENNKLVVEDNGIGFSGNNIEDIFLESYRSKEARTQYKRGSGLGLYIVKELLDKNGNKINVVKKDKGLKFVVTFRN